MYLVANLGDHRSYRNGNIDSFINCYMDILQKAELTASIHHIARFFKSGIPIYSSEDPDTAGRKLKRRTYAIVKRFAFHPKTQNKTIHICELYIVL